MRFQPSEMMGTATAQDLVIMKNYVPTQQFAPQQFLPESLVHQQQQQLHLHQQMLHMRQQQMMHLHHLQQTATPQPRYQQSISARSHSAPYFPSGIPSSSSSASLKIASPMKLAATRAGRRASMMEEVDVNLFVSPLSVEPRQRHLARQKLKFTYLCDVPESMVVQSSCGLHSYKVEAPKSRLVGEFPQQVPPPHFSGMGMFVAGESPSSVTDGEVSNDGEGLDEDDDPVFCSSPRLDNPLSESVSSPGSSRGLTPDLPAISLMDRLHELEQMMGSTTEVL